MDPDAHQAPRSVPGHGLLGADRWIDVAGGRRVRAMLAGAGEDLVVLEAGIGSSGLYWGPVHAAIAPHARVVATERAGYGASTPVRARARGLADLVADLGAVIATIPHRRLVLVGHSWGGPIVRSFAAGHLERGGTVHGVVLVDQSDEHAADLYASALARWSGALQNGIMVPLAHARLLGPLMRTQLAGLPAHLLTAVLAASSTAAAARAIVAENRPVVDELLALRRQPLALPGVPLSVISGERMGPGERRIRARLVGAHRETARAHPGARWVGAARSGHMIPVTEPELVAAEALSLLR